MNVSLWCTKIIRWSYYALVVVVPLIWLPWNYELFEFNKMMVTYAVTAVIFCAWIAKSLANGKFSIAKTPLDIPILLFFLSQLVASFFSIDPHVSWFGYYSRFNGGMWSIICYIILYYAFVTHFLDEADSPQNPKSQIPNPKQIQNSKPNESKNTILPLLYTSLLTALAVSLWGIAESFGVDKNWWVQDVQHRVFSTLGQPNWLAAYLVALIPVAMALALVSLLTYRKKSIKEPWTNAVTPGFLFWVTVATVFLWTLLLTRSRSGYLGLGVADLVFCAIVAWWAVVEKKIKLILPWAVIVHVLFVIVVFFTGTKIDTIDGWLTFEGLQQRFASLQNAKVVPKEAKSTAEPQSGTTLLEVGITESTNIRKHVWNAAVSAWRSSTKTFFVGTGTETFAFAFYQFRPKEHNMTSEWDFLYNKAHNEYLNYLATTGALGLGSYLLILFLFYCWFLRRILHFQTVEILFAVFFGLIGFFAIVLFNLLKVYFSRDTETKKILPESSLDSSHSYLSFALFAGWLSILITNFFGFSVVIMQIFLFLFPAIVIASNYEKTKPLRSLSLPEAAAFRKFGVATAAIASIFLLANLVVGWIADLYFAQGYRNNRIEDFAKSEPLLATAVALRSGEPFYHDEWATALAGKAVASLTEKDIAAAADFAKRAIAETDRALGQSPNNVNYWKTRTKIFYSFSTFDQQFTQQAVQALEEGLKLSPNDPKIMYNLSVLYGRAGMTDEAIFILKKGIEVKPDYRDLYNGLYVFYSETKRPKEAREILTFYLTRVNPDDQEFKKFLKEL